MPRGLACATDRTKLLVKSPCETALKSWSWAPPSPPVNEHLHMCYDWPVKNTIIEGNIETHWDWEPRIMARLCKMLLTGNRLCLQHRLH